MQAASFPKPSYSILKNCRDEFFAVDEDLRAHSSAREPSEGYLVGGSGLSPQRCCWVEPQNPPALEQESEPQSGWLRPSLCPDCVRAQRLPRQNRCLDGTYRLHGEGDSTQPDVPDTQEQSEKRPSPKPSLLLRSSGPQSTSSRWRAVHPGKDHSPHQNGFIFTLEGIPLCRWMATKYDMELKVKNFFISFDFTKFLL